MHVPFCMVDVHLNKHCRRWRSSKYSLTDRRIDKLQTRCHERVQKTKNSPQRDQHVHVPHAAPGFEVPGWAATLIQARTGFEILALAL